MSIQKEFTIRYREEGHVRFQIPDQVCDETVAKIVQSELLAIEGVYKVNLFNKQKKLSIRYKEVVCDFKQLAIRIYDVLAKLDEQGLLVPQVAQEEVDSTSSKWNIKSKVKSWKATHWMSEKYDDAKDTVKAAKILTKVGIKKGPLIKDPEKAIIDFLNDILVLYLIKLHWVRITQEWIPKPWTFRYQWTAVFYLFYLLMRSRKPK